MSQAPLTEGLILNTPLCGGVILSDTLSGNPVASTFCRKIISWRVLPNTQGL